MMTLPPAVRRSTRRRDAANGRRREGFSLIEIVVAMTILSIVLLSLAKLSTIVGVRGRANAVVLQRNAAMQAEVSKIGAIPYSNLATWSTTFTKDTVDTLNGFVYKRRTKVTPAASGARSTVKIVLMPMSDTTMKDSAVFDRSQPSSGTPLCVGC